MESKAEAKPEPKPKATAASTASAVAIDTKIEEEESSQRRCYLTSPCYYPDCILVQGQKSWPLADAMIQESESRSCTMLLPLHFREESTVTAMKALAILNHRMQDEDKEVYCLVDYDGFKNVLLRTCRVYAWISDDRKTYTTDQEVRIGQNSVPQKVGGFIAKVFIDKKKLSHMCVRACGTIPLTLAVQSIYFARNYLQKEHLDIAMIPQFATDGEFTLINIFISCFEL